MEANFRGYRYEHFFCRTSVKRADIRSTKIGMEKTKLNRTHQTRKGIYSCSEFGSDSAVLGSVLT
jgi:hypothetical protein